MKMETFLKLITIVTKNFMLDTARSHEYIFRKYSLFLLFHRSRESQRILKNLNKIYENHLWKSSLLKRCRFLISILPENKLFHRYLQGFYLHFCKYFSIAASKLNEWMNFCGFQSLYWRSIDDLTILKNKS